MTRDGDPAAVEIFERHYSARDVRNRKLFVGPGLKVVLIGKNLDGLFVWRKFISDSGEEGVNCAVFRNETKKPNKWRGSLLILQAEQVAREYFPTDKRYYTYVDAAEVKSTNPGCCFKKAGWEFCGTTKENGLLIFEKIVR